MSVHEVNESNIYKITHNKDEVLLTFAYVESYREGLTDEDVQDIKIIKIKPSFLTNFTKSLLEIAEKYESESDTDILHKQ